MTLLLLFFFFTLDYMLLDDKDSFLKCTNNHHIERLPYARHNRRRRPSITSATLEHRFLGNIYSGHTVPGKINRAPAPRSILRAQFGG